MSYILAVARQHLLNYYNRKLGNLDRVSLTIDFALVMREAGATKEQALQLLDATWDNLPDA
jgi:hypothetical protein